MEQNLIYAGIFVIGALVGIFIGAMATIQQQKEDKQNGIKNPFYNPNPRKKKCYSCDNMVDHYTNYCSKCTDKAFGY